MDTRRGPAGLRLSALGALVVMAAGCHHVIIDGGRDATDTRFDEEWNLAFAAAIYPAEVDATGMCGGYFSRVETRMSFLNLVVSSWTLGWISPMEARLQCGVPDAQDGAREDGAGAEEVGDAR